MPRDDGWQELSPIFDDDEDVLGGSGGEGDVGIGVAGGRSSWSYYRMPDPLLRLSVNKLDGSSFDVQIARTAHVRDLKLAVESFFMQTPREGGIHISWSHVWSHFCLSYMGEKLIDDAETLQNLRIKDGDQLCFIRHFSINISPIHRLPRYGVLEPGRKHRRTMTAPEFLRRFEENGMEKKIMEIDESPSSLDERRLICERKENDAGRKEFRLSHFLLGWLSCVGLQRSGKTRSQVRTHPSGVGGNS